MNEIERRALLGAAGIGAVAALSKAGPLNPPGGSVASTGRTLDEIYNRIPTLPATGGYDGRTPISTPAAILNPGSYVLATNLMQTGPVITLAISASDVTVDLNGFRVGNTGTTGACIALTGNVSNVTIRNGSTSGGEAGVYADSGAAVGILLEDLRIYRSHLSGIVFNHVLARDVIIRRCHVCDVGVTTSPADVSTAVAGINYRGSACRIDDCSVHNLVNASTGAQTIRGIWVNSTSAGNTVSRCHLSNPFPIGGTGIVMNAGSTVYRDNTVTAYTAPYSGGANGGGNV